jgi:hypothetical protein
MFAQRFRTCPTQQFSKRFTGSHFRAGLSLYAAAIACVSILTLGSNAFAQSARLQQIASIPDTPRTSTATPASIVADPAATGRVYVVNSDGSILSIDGSNGRIPTADPSATCSLIPSEALTANDSTETASTGKIIGGATSVIAQNKIYNAPGDASLQVLNAASVNTCQTPAQISGTGNVQPGLIATDTESNKIYAISAASIGGSRLLIIDGATDKLDSAIPSIQLDAAGNYSSIVVDDAGLSPTHLVFISESGATDTTLNRIWVMDPSTGNSLKIPGYAGTLFVAPGSEQASAQLVVAGATSVNVFSIADISLTGPPPSPISSATYNATLLGNATQYPANAVLSSPVMDAVHGVLYGNFYGSVDGGLSQHVLLSVDLATLGAGANSNKIAGISLGKLGSSGSSSNPSQFALAVDAANRLVYAIPLSASSSPDSAGSSFNWVQAFRSDGQSVYTVPLTASATHASSTEDSTPLTPSQIVVAPDGKVYIAGSSMDAASTAVNYSVAVMEASPAASPAATTTTLVAAPTTVAYGTTVTYTATVTSSSGVPTGSVNFISGGVTLATETLNSTGVAIFATSSGQIGKNTLYAQYVGNSEFASSSSNQAVVTVETIPTTTTLSTPTPTAVVTTYVVFNVVVKDTTGTGVPTGIVEFLYDGVKGGGIATLDSSGAGSSGDRYLTPGTHTIQAVYQGDSTHAISRSNTITVTILPQIQTTTTLTTPTPTAVMGEYVVFNVQVSDNTGTGVPTGVVEFLYDGVKGGGVATLNSSGAGTSGDRYLTPGTHTIQGVYQGDSSHAISRSNILIINIVDFSVTANPSTLSIAQGKIGTSVLTLTSLGGFDLPVELKCVEFPKNSTCKLSSATVTPTAAGATTNVTITTNQSPIYAGVPSNPYPGSRSPRPMMALAGSGFAGLVLLLGLRNRKSIASLRSWSNVLLGAALFGTILSLASSCGFQNPKTPTGTDTVQITATGTYGSTVLSHSVSIQVTITQ